MRDKIIWTINIALVLTAVFLVLHFFEVELPSVGMAQYYLDKSNPVCVANFKEDYSLVGDMGQCCLELQSQLECEGWQEEILVGGEKLRINKKCHTGESVIGYLINNKAYNFCLREGYLGVKWF